MAVDVEPLVAALRDRQVRLERHLGVLDDVHVLQAHRLAGAQHRRHVERVLQPVEHHRQRARAASPAPRRCAPCAVLQQQLARLRRAGCSAARSLGPPPVIASPASSLRRPALRLLRGQLPLAASRPSLLRRLRLRRRDFAPLASGAARRAPSPRRSSSAWMPSPVAPESGSTAMPRAFIAASNAGSRSRACGRSSLFATTTCGLSASSALYRCSSRLMIVEVVQRLAPLALRAQVHQVHQHPAPLHVAQELVPQPRAFARALDQPGDVGHHERQPVLVLDHAQVRHQRGERVVGDLRARARRRAR